jgi:glyoxylase-like metal-dependent hydrolase (beta-lactamase superfamily II)
LEGMRKHYGLKAIDAVIITHMHGDHFLEAFHLREKWGTKIWAFENMVDKMEHPEWFDYAAPIQAYGKKNPDGSQLEGVHVDRAFKPGEAFKWEEYSFTVDWMPGQTEFALCLHGRIDGRNVAFTGDTIFGDPDDPAQTGHEAMVAHNSAILEEGYIYGAEDLKRLKPDLLVGGHSFVMDHPAAFIERYRKWSYEMRDAFRALSPDPDYRYWFDPFWVRAEPYRIAVRAGETATLNLHVRNFRSRKQTHRIEIHAPPGIRVDPAVVEGSLARETQGSFPVHITADPKAPPGVRIVALDVRLDNHRYGELFDFVVGVLTNSPRSVSVTRTNYHGWPDSLLLSNEEAEVAIVPAVGRVMQFGFVGQPGVFWENRALDGKAPESDMKQWINFGGDKTWPAPEADWARYTGHGWCPPPAFDGMPADSKVENGDIVLTTPVDRYYGISAQRRIHLDPARPVLSITTTYTRRAGEPSRVGVWVITQLKDPAAIFLPRVGQDPLTNEVVSLSPTLPPDLTADKDLVCLTRDPKSPYKLGSQAGVLVWVGAQTAVRIDAPRVIGAEYPDHGSSVEVYTNQDPLQYVELETLGPLQTLKRGDSITRTNTYTLLHRTLSSPRAEALRLLQL